MWHKSTPKSQAGNRQLLSSSHFDNLSNQGANRKMIRLVCLQIHSQFLQTGKVFVPIRILSPMRVWPYLLFPFFILNCPSHHQFSWNILQRGNIQLNIWMNRWTNYTDMGSQVETIGSSQVPTSACQVRCAGRSARVATQDSHSTDRRNSTITEDACQHALGAGPTEWRRHTHRAAEPVRTE